MKRRNFLKGSAIAGMSSMLLGKTRVFAHDFQHPFARLAQMADDSDRVLVLVQLNGGNDGLNTLIPLDQYDNLQKARPDVIIPKRKVLNLHDHIGLHPSMGQMKHLYNENKIAIVQGVGYPEPNFSHFRSTDIWTSGSPAEDVWNTGWVGRFLESEFQDFPVGYPNPEQPHPPAITIGSIVSNTCQGQSVNLGLAVSNPDRFSQLPSSTGMANPNSPYGKELTFMRQMINQTNEYLEAILDASTKGSNVSKKYLGQEKNRLANELKIVARLIAGGLRTKVYVVNIGGFDTHANQVEADDTTLGDHAELLQKVSEGIAAFQEDLEMMQLDHRVIGMTFSEFGRRIKANGSLGTDHGAAAPMFFFGKAVNPKIFGENPLIPEEVERRDNLPMLYDFRSIYGSVLMDWFGVEEEKIKEWLFDDFVHVPVIKTRKANRSLLQKEQQLFLKVNRPNPFDNRTFVDFWLKEAGTVQIRAFDSAGKVVKEIANEEFTVGNHSIRVDGSNWRPGKYYIHARSRHSHDMVIAIKQ
ncbi:MAG: DUF1501 domain-containing protein [Bacteroidia bacterium]|nr:DUF1501 domain-containing protein [Bacteroidia bacterium]